MKRNNKKRKNKTVHEHFLNIVTKVFLGGAIVFGTFAFSGFIVLCIMINQYLKELPEIDISVFKNVSQTSYIYDRYGNRLASYNDIENRRWISLKEIPQFLQDAVVSTEDKRFYEHGGYDVKGILNAVISFVGGKQVRGGSTITQQLVKNTILTNETTLKRKVQEIVLSEEVEKRMSKDQILEAYLNIIYLGESNYGIAAAAEDYFSVEDLSELSEKECAMLAGLTKNPYYYNPRANMYSRDAFGRNEERISTVLYMMQVNGKITEDEYYKYMAQDIKINEIAHSAGMYSFPHFIEYAVEDVIDGFIQYRQLENTKENRAAIEEEIRTKGYRINTTIDPKIQEDVQKSLAEYPLYPVFKRDDEHPNADEKAQAAAVVIDQSTGEVVALVGSRNTPTVMKSFNRAVKNNMPVGSVIKPLSTYGPVLENAVISPESPVLNIKAKIEGYDINDGYPGGGEDPQGIVTVRYALEHSLNVPVARLLCRYVGYEKSAEYLTAMGIDYESISVNGSGLVLGSSGIDMLDMTGAYATIANGGVYKEPRTYTTVTSSDGTVILNAESVKTSRTVFSKATCYSLTDMMKGVITEGTGTKARLENITAAGKTGTSENKSLTFAGFTGYYTSCVWIGNDSFLGFDESIEDTLSAAPLWNLYMDKIHSGLEDKDILGYSAEECGLVPIEICLESGQIAGEHCKHKTTGYFAQDKLPEQSCEMHGEVYEKYGKPYIKDGTDIYSLGNDIIMQLYPKALIGEEELIAEQAAEEAEAARRHSEESVIAAEEYIMYEYESNPTTEYLVQ